MSYEENCSLRDALIKWIHEDCGLDKAVMDKFKDRKVVFFIGAGVSRLEGIMGWDDFSNKLIKEAFPRLCDREQLLQSHISSKEKISIAYEQFCKENNTKKFYEEFGKALTPQKQKSTGIYQVLSQFNVNYLTTNADTLFENILGKDCCFTDFDKEKLFNQDHISRGQLFYLHGRYRKNSKNENLVFTAANYVKRYNDKNFCDFLKQVFNKDCAVFFIGYGLNEYELIDYISTKVGLQNNGESSLIYSLEPFLSTQETLFFARRMYFKSLGIKILPYNKDDGYSELKKVLEKMLNVFKMQANVPHDDYQDIQYNINKKCTKAVLSEVNKMLHRNMTDGRFNVACNVLKKSRYWRSWGRMVINDESWFPTDDIKQYLSWSSDAIDRISLLHWLIANTHDTYYVYKARQILECVAKADADLIKETSCSLLVQYINVICSLDNSLLKDDFFDFIDSAFVTCGQQISYFGLSKENQITKWDSYYLKRFILSVLNGMPNINGILFEEEKPYVNYFEKNTSISYSQNIAKIFFDCFYEYAKSNIKEEMFNPLYYISNLDNVKKAHYSGWQSILEKLVFYFKQLNSQVQAEYINEGLTDENDTICKIWLYILRHTIADTSFLLNDDVKCFTFERCLCELYLLIKESTSKNTDKLLVKIENSSFGINLKLYDEKYYVSIKNSLKTALGCSVDGECYDLVGVADQCDYVHVSDVPKENFENVSIDDLFVKMKSSAHDYEKSNIAEAIVQKFLGEQKEQLDRSLELMNELKDEELNFIILQVRMQDEYINEFQKAKINMYVLNILLSERSNDLLIKNCLALLARADLNILFNAHENLLNLCWQKWKNIQIPEDIDSTKKDILFQLINTSEYERVSFLCNYWVTKKNLQKTICSNEFLEFLKSDAKRIISRWCFSFRICDIIGIVGGDKAKELINVLVYNNDHVDYMAVLIIVCSMKVVTKDFCDLIKSIDILNNQEVLKKDKQLTMALYGYCSAAYFYGKLTLADIRSVLNDNTFCETLFFFLNVKITKNDSLTIKKFKIELWPEIRIQVQKNSDLKKTVYNVMLTFLLGSADNSELIDIIIEILHMCQNLKEGIYIDGRKTINLLKQYPAKAQELAKLILTQCNNSIYYDDIENIIKYWSEENIDFAKNLLVEIYKNGKISLEFYEKLFNIIDSKNQ